MRELPSQMWAVEYRETHEQPWKVDQTFTKLGDAEYKCSRIVKALGWEARVRQARIEWRP